MSDIQAVIQHIGEAGRHLAEINASEGSAGNISAYLGKDLPPPPAFSQEESMILPVVVPELAGGAFVVTGSGRRLREIAGDPEANLGYMVIEPGGARARFYTSPRRLFARVTVEFNTHLAVHHDQITRHDLSFHAIIHAQPFHLVYLSHIPRYQDALTLNRHLLRWQPECIYYLPEGIALAPFLLSGSAELMTTTVEALRTHQLILWAKHGVLARSAASVKRACDLIEYAEVGARYECFNLSNHEMAEGLTLHEIHLLCREFNIPQKIF
jgi:rhamnulose-1-phosphate aldolase